MLNVLQPVEECQGGNVAPSTCRPPEHRQETHLWPAAGLRESSLLPLRPDVLGLTCHGLVCGPRSCHG